jgi:transposase
MKHDIISASFDNKKSTICCVNNQPCLFNHSVMMHTVIENILCHFSPVESTKEKSTMYLAEEIRPQFIPEQPQKTYSQQWTSYNQAQTNEKTRFLELLYELCSQIDELPRAHTGRVRIPLSDMVFAVVYKIYSGVSGRRFMSDLAEAHKKGYISTIPHFNSLFNYLEIDEIHIILKELILESAKPLKAIEFNFAVDSSGFTKGQSKVAWQTAKYRDKNIQIQDWLKCHLICGVVTNIVTSVEITHGTAADTNYFKPLVDATAEHFTINQVSADKAYLSVKNLRLVESKGGMPFIPFKENSRPNHATKDSLWRNLYYFYQLHNDKFKAFYHQRSNVETTFSMIKRKFGERLKCKTEKAQINELLCKVLCHNLCCVVQSIYELGIETDFYRD